MPYSNNGDMPGSVTGAIESQNGQTLFRRVVNSQLQAGKSDAVAFASAWSALQNDGYNKSEDGKWVKKESPSADSVHVPSTRWKKPKKPAKKYQQHQDAFTMPSEAMTRSLDLGLEGDWHVYDMDGQGVYMPGATHEAYLAAVGEMGEEGYEEEVEIEIEEAPVSPNEDMFRVFINTIMERFIKEEGHGSVEDPAQVPDDFFKNPIIKVDEEKQIVWGWASVSTIAGDLVVDLHGDMIKTETMVEAADDFMMYKRTAKAMHQGNGIGFVLHSFPYTHELGKALGFKCEREGWVVAMKILDANHWAKVKSGEFRGFSIGGKGQRIATT